MADCETQHAQHFKSDVQFEAKTVDFRLDAVRLVLSSAEIVCPTADATARAWGSARDNWRELLNLLRDGDLFKPTRIFACAHEEEYIIGARTRVVELCHGLIAQLTEYKSLLCRVAELSL
jgi:hypothetical protein